MSLFCCPLHNLLRRHDRLCRFEFHFAEGFKKTLTKPFHNTWKSFACYILMRMNLNVNFSQNFPLEGNIWMIRVEEELDRLAAWNAHAPRTFTFR